MDIRESLEKFLDPHDREDYPVWLNRLRSVFLVLLGILCMAAPFAIPVLIVVGIENCSGSGTPSEISGESSVLWAVVFILVAIAVACFIYYGFYKLLGSKTQSKAKRIIKAILLTIVVLGLIALFIYICGVYDFGGPRVNDAHFGRG